MPQGVQSLVKDLKQFFSYFRKLSLFLDANYLLHSFLNGHKLVADIVIHV